MTESLRYRVDEYMPKQKRWQIGAVTYRDNDRHRRQLARLLAENEAEGVETRVVDLMKA